MERIRRDIRKDVDRLHWESPLCEGLETRTAISDILLSYCVTEGRMYKQGMHEIVAFLYSIGHRDRSILSLAEDTGPSGKEAEEARGDASTLSAVASGSDALRVWIALYRRVSDESSQLAWTYALFRRVMASDDVDSTGGAAGGGGYGLASWYFSPQELRERSDCADSVDGVNEPTGVVVAAERVQRDLLATQDADLQRRLDSDYGIRGAVYSIRWLRLLFLREFSFRQSVAVWSALFAEMRMCRLRGRAFDLSLSLALHLATAMLTHIREDLMTESIHALQQLMHYPPLEDIRVLLCAAVRASANPLLHVCARLPRHLEARGSHGQECSSLGDGEAAKVMVRQGERLSIILARLERYWFRPPDNLPHSSAEESRATEEYVQAIAELKKVRDVLLFGVDD